MATGQKVATLQDEDVSTGGYLYTRSVCFSPDGKYLATGGDDKQTRVSCTLGWKLCFQLCAQWRSVLMRKFKVWDIALCTIKNVYSGHEQEIFSLDFASNGRYLASGSRDKTICL